MLTSANKSSILCHIVGRNKKTLTFKHQRFGIDEKSDVDKNTEDKRSRDTN
uniref:Uncharacterized protein n=1 Tax=Trichobilharzia regenti TaxID=157069 RepID=A0AA85IW53_TRIRE|nr:unnamed protein product [Trichobilharzia regenti]